MKRIRFRDTMASELKCYSAGVAYDVPDVLAEELLRKGLGEPADNAAASGAHEPREGTLETTPETTITPVSEPPEPREEAPVQTPKKPPKKPSRRRVTQAD